MPLGCCPVVVCMRSVCSLAGGATAARRELTSSMGEATSEFIAEWKGYGEGVSGWSKQDTEDIHGYSCLSLVLRGNAMSNFALPYPSALPDLKKWKSADHMLNS